MSSDRYPILDLENFQLRQLLEISLLDHQTEGVNLITAHKHDFFLFFLIEDGSGTHIIDFKTYNVSDRQIHILLPDQVHEWNLRQNTKGYQLMISKDIMSTFSDYLDFSSLLYFDHPIVCLSDQMFCQIKHVFDILDFELKRDVIEWSIIYTTTRLVSQMIMREIYLSYEDFSRIKSNAILIKFINLMNENYKNNKTVSFYADQLNISPNYLNILCKKYIKISASTIIKNRILLESKRLLSTSNITIKEISFELGFNDLSYFSNFFKENIGISPRQFRDQL